jgi:hypothetical protein
MVEYRPWQIRGYDKPVYMVWVENPSSLVEVKRELNNPPVKGMLIVQNKSRACERLGWEKMEDGVWYKIFD